MLARNIAVIAPDSNDPLHSILKDLGEVGEEKDVLGEEGKTEVVLYILKGYNFYPVVLYRFAATGWKQSAYGADVD